MTIQVVFTFDHDDVDDISLLSCFYELLQNDDADFNFFKMSVTTRRWFDLFADYVVRRSVDYVEYMLDEEVSSIDEIPYMIRTLYELRTKKEG